jgi:hypothetical protein
VCERLQLRLGGLGRHRITEPQPLHRLRRLVVADDGDVAEFFEHGTLVAESEVDGLYRNAGLVGDVLQRRPGVPVFQEQLACGRQNPSPRLPRLLGPLPAEDPRACKDDFCRRDADSAFTGRSPRVRGRHLLTSQFPAV